MQVPDEHVTTSASVATTPADGDDCSNRRDLLDQLSGVVVHPNLIISAFLVWSGQSMGDGATLLVWIGQSTSDGTTLF